MSVHARNGPQQILKRKTKAQRRKQWKRLVKELRLSRFFRGDMKAMIQEEFTRLPKGEGRRTIHALYEIAAPYRVEKKEWERRRAELAEYARKCLIGRKGKGSDHVKGLKRKAG